MTTSVLSPSDDLHDPKDTVLRTLELEIVLGRLLPRERLVEDELMDRLGAKRNHVRTALIALEGMGLVERRPNRGSVVRTYDAQEVEELTAFRADLHRMAVAQMPLPLPTPQGPAARPAQAAQEPPQPEARASGARDEGKAYGLTQQVIFSKMAKV